MVDQLTAAASGDLNASGGQQAKRKRRWWVPLVVIVVVLGVLAGAAELALRAIVPNLVAAAVRSPLNLTADHEVDVELGGSVLLHTLTGKVGDIAINIDSVPLMEDLTGDVSLQADSVPINAMSGEIAGGKAQLTLPKDHIGPVVSLLTQGIADSGKVSGDTIEVGRTIAVFGQEVPVTAAVRVGVENGDVVIDPAGVRVVGLDLDAKQLSKTTGGLLDPVLTPQTICVRDQLPKGVELTDITLSSTGSVSVDADFAPGILSDEKQQEKGSCG